VSSSAVETASRPWDAAEAGLPERSLAFRLVKAARGVLDRVIARDSLISNEPILDARAFEWTGLLQAEWEAIRAEAERLLPRIDAIPPLRMVSPDHRDIVEEDLWRSFFLCGYGYKVEKNCDQCPRTAELIERIPELNCAFFSILLPGTHIKRHRGPTKALVTCHLGLLVPPGDVCRMELADRTVGWREGEWLVFDDTYFHEIFHVGNQPRIVLLLQVKRPLRGFGKRIADLFLGGIRRSPFVQEARRNVEGWDQAARALDTQA
jgi:beta-hydroxylase